MAKIINLQKKSRAHIPSVLKVAKANNIQPMWCEKDGIYATPLKVCPYCGTKGIPYKEVEK